MTNLGLRIELPLIVHPSSSLGERLVAVLNYGLPGLPAPLGIYVQREDTKDRLFRVEPYAMIKGVDTWKQSKVEVVFIQDQQSSDPISVTQRQNLSSYRFLFQRVLPQGNGFTYTTSAPLKTSQLDPFIDLQMKQIDVIVDQQWWLQTRYLFEDRRGEQFVMLIGVYEDRPRIDIITSVTGDRKLVMADVKDQYFDLLRGEHFRMTSRWEGLEDCVSKPLSGNRMVSAAVRKALVRGKTAFKVHISVKLFATPKSLKVIDVIPPPRRYDVLIVRLIDDLENRYTFSGFAPFESWKSREDESRVLMSTTDDGITGSFRMISDWGSAAVVLGIRNGRVWADATYSKTDLERFRASYDRNGRREGVPALHCTQIVEPFGFAHSLKVEIEDTRYVGQEVYQAKISVISGIKYERSSKFLEVKIPRT